MTRLLTLFSIVASAASIVGLLVQLLRPAEQWPETILLPVFGVAAVLCLYVLFVPGSWFEGNVRSKLAGLYRAASKTEADILIQEGTIRFWASGQRTIKFSQAFLEEPLFELIDQFDDFREPGTLPEVKSVTRNAAVIDYQPTYILRSPRCGWVARGKALQKIR